jgi:hypothetical protein
VTDLNFCSVVELHEIDTRAILVDFEILGSTVSCINSPYFEFALEISKERDIVKLFKIQFKKMDFVATDNLKMSLL